MADEKAKKKGNDEAPEPEEKKKKKKKKGEEPEDAADELPGKKGKPGKEKKEKKRHPALKAFLLTSLVWLTALIVFAALTFLNFFTLKEVVLQLLNPEEDFEVVFGYEIAMLKEWEEELNLRESELDIFEYDLDDRESALDDRESDLDDREYELEANYPWVFDDDPQVIENLFDINSVAKAAAAMSPERAAKAILAMDLDSALRLMSVMRPAEYGAILEQMPEDEAASFLDAMTASE